MLEALERVPTTGLTDKFAKFIASKIIKIKLKLGMGFKEEQLANELHHKIIHKFERRTVIIKDLDETWSSDLVVMPKKDGDWKYILLVIDNFSKYGWAFPLKSKKPEELIECFKEIFKSGRKCKKLWTDHGNEYYGSKFQIFLMENEIALYSTFSELKACIAERFVRTMKSLMWKKFTELNNDKQWVKLIPEILSIYNNNEHSTIKMSPIEASRTENVDKVKSIYDAKLRAKHNKPPKFEIGDFVRIYRWKGFIKDLTKGYTQNFTKEIFKIVEKHYSLPWTYSIVDKNNEKVEGKFYEKQMIKSKFDFDNILIAPPV
jgi:hypothetical protein